MKIHDLEFPIWTEDNPNASIKNHYQLRFDSQRFPGEKYPRVLEHELPKYLVEVDLELACS